MVEPWPNPSSVISNQPLSSIHLRLFDILTTQRPWKHPCFWHPPHPTSLPPSWQRNRKTFSYNVKDHLIRVISMNWVTFCSTESRLHAKVMAITNKKPRKSWNVIRLYLFTHLFLYFYLPFSLFRICYYSKINRA